MEFGIPNSVAQPLFFGFAGLVGLFVLWFIFLRKDETFSKGYVAFAQRTGLRFTPPVSLGKMIQGVETSVLEGQLGGAPVRLVAERSVNTRAAGISGRTTFVTRAHVPANLVFAIHVEEGRGQPAAGGVPTGDVRFDVMLCVRSDNPGAAAALLDPNVRGVALSRPSGWLPLTLRYDRGEITLQAPSFAYEEAHFDFGFKLILAAGAARLA